MFRQNILTKDITTKIIEKAAGKVPQKSLEDFLCCIEKESHLHYFTKSSESNLISSSSFTPSVLYTLR